MPRTFLVACAFLTLLLAAFAEAAPNMIFILTDDQRADALGCAGNERIHTPNLDAVAERGTRFSNAFVTLSICSPSRAACLTGRYGSANGVTAVGRSRLRDGERTFAHRLKEAGYYTGVTGKWHLGTKPAECGFEFASTCFSNGPWYDREFQIHGKKNKAAVEGFVDDVVASESIRFIKESAAANKPFALWMCTQSPHMDHRYRWPARQEYVDHYKSAEMPLADTWQDDLAGKPTYLKTARNRTQALSYGYERAEAIQDHTRDYYAGIEQMDAAIGRVLASLDGLGLRQTTWVIVMGDNGWFLGEHGLTSKVLPYEESIRVPMIVSGPDTVAAIDEHLVLNIDLTATMLAIAGVTIPQGMHGRSLLPLVHGKAADDWRTSFLYEAPTPQLGSQPLWAVRTERWKFVATHPSGNGKPIVELYDLAEDAQETTNLATVPAQADTVQHLSRELRRLRAELSPNHVAVPDENPDRDSQEQVDPPATETAIRNDLLISGIYPRLTTYGIYSQNGAHLKGGHDECGIGAVVPWSGKLWMVNYAPHMPQGSEHKLYSVDEQLNLTIHPESVGGTPAARMIHRESNQLLIGHYLINTRGDVRVISPKVMPGRMTAIARHLSDPKSLVYYVDMEGMLYEGNVHTLDVKKLFQKPVPGWHGKGAYTAQGRLVVANNGEHAAGSYKPLFVGGPAKNDDEIGVLAEWDGKNWKIVERRQFTDVTGPDGIYGGADARSPLWAIGWDRRSLRLKLLDQGNWHTFLLPKAAHNNDPRHGWYTEWPRIREIGGGRMMMDMHGMFFDFPKTFSADNSAGLAPISSHLRYVPDFCDWNGRLVLASDETSIQGNRLAGQPQSNLWFGRYEDLKTWGPASGYGGPWVRDSVSAGTPSDPFLVAGFDKRVLHLALGAKNYKPIDGALRASDQQAITQIPPSLVRLPRVTIDRGDWHAPAPGYSFTVNRPVTVYLAVDQRGTPDPGDGWSRTDLTLTWGQNHRDSVYRKAFDAGNIKIASNKAEHTPGAFGMPHTAFVDAGADDLRIEAPKHVRVAMPAEQTAKKPPAPGPVRFTLEMDVNGRGNWIKYRTIEVPQDGYVFHVLEQNCPAKWMRLTADKDCIATAYFHLTDAEFHDGKSGKKLFDGLAAADVPQVRSGLVYAAKRNRNLRVITGDDRYCEFTKETFKFLPDKKDNELRSLLKVEPEFSVDEASVIINLGHRRLRLPKGHAAYDKPFASGWPRGSREVESERHLANFHGTFYEVPLITNGRTPAFDLMRPVASHAKQITDFCSWNGLLVLAGIRPDAVNDGHVFADSRLDTALWFGGVDDLWKLGKPVGKGGPWKNTVVKAGRPSDAYLMTGYDTMTLRLSADKDVEITVEVDVDHQSGWHRYDVFEIEAGHELVHQFPVGFSAHWLRVTADTDCRATAWMVYD